MSKEYLGDGAYVEFDGNGLWLTTSDGISTTNEIYLEPEVYAALLKYVERLKEREQERHQTGCICADCSGAELTADND